MNPVASSPWLVLVVAALPLSACAGSLTYSAEAIEARVIDAETRQPLEGVVVTANWQLEEGTFGGNVQAGQLMVMEAVTDKNGVFRFPAWGPKKAPKGHLVNDDPQLLFFKPGYEYRRLNNDYSGDREMRLRTVRRSKWSGRGIEMKVYTSARREYASYLAGEYRRELRFVFESNEWKALPCLLLALDRTARGFGYDGVTKFMRVPNIAREREIAEFVRENAVCKEP